MQQAWNSTDTQSILNSRPQGLLLNGLVDQVGDAWAGLTGYNPVNNTYYGPTEQQGAMWRTVAGSVMTAGPEAMTASRASYGLDALGANSSVRYTGAGTTKYDIAAEAAYAEIRGLHMTDVEAFAQNSGLTVSEATTLKKQLFFGRHEYPVDGSTVVRQRFAADHEIAFAWKAASEGEISATQQAWIRQLADHELAERSFMAQGVPYLRREAWNGSSFGAIPPGAHNLAPKPPNTTFPGYDIPSNLWD
jgi:hypothetical protein